MKIYMVRHGESVGNVAKVVQSQEEELTQKGITQARHVSARFVGIKIDKIVASPATRTLHTANIIADKTGARIVTEEIFVERKHPVSLVGYTHDSPEFEKYEISRLNSLDDKTWRYEDAETPTDLSSRAEAAKVYLQNLHEEHVIVVTHGIFMRVFFTHIYLGHMFVPQIYHNLMNLRTVNTGVTVFDVDKSGDKPAWTVLCWNDYSHLPS